MASAQAWLDGVTTAVHTGAYVDPARSWIIVGVMAQQWLASEVNLKAHEARTVLRPT